MTDQPTVTARDIVEDNVLVCASWMVPLIYKVAFGETNSALDHLPFDESTAYDAINVLQYAELEVPEPLVDKFGPFLNVERVALDNTRESLEAARDELADEIDGLSDIDESQWSDEQRRMSEKVDAYDELLYLLDSADWKSRDAYECWYVSDWLGAKLEQHGEAVMNCGAFGRLWLRCATGQAIHMDSVIQDIAQE